MYDNEKPYREQKRNLVVLKQKLDEKGRRVKNKEK